MHSNRCTLEHEYETDRAKEYELFMFIALKIRSMMAAGHVFVMSNNLQEMKIYNGTLETVQRSNQ